MKQVDFWILHICWEKVKSLPKEQIHIIKERPKSYRRSKVKKLEYLQASNKKFEMSSDMEG